jgi:DEAD/DEAH box helicase domain-containing protein
MWELVQQQDEEPRRLSSIAEVAHLFAELVRHGMRTIAFCTTRKLSELVLTYAQDALRASGHHNLCDMIMSYRGGYTPEQVPEQKRPE